MSAPILQAAALVLGYPDESLLAHLDLVEQAVGAAGAGSQFAPVLAHLRGGPSSDEEGRTDRLGALQSYHVQEFDLSRRHSLHLSYWTDGDTRRRGTALAAFKQAYRDSGLLVDTAGELPDYLPMVLEFAAQDPDRGLELLQRYRASLELIRLGLMADGLPHAGVLAAVCGLLPGASPATAQEVQERFGAPQPVELVGLDLLSGPPAPVGVGLGRS